MCYQIYFDSLFLTKNNHTKIIGFQNFLCCFLNIFHLNATKENKRCQKKLQYFNIANAEW
jgi:hypothetical protein